MNTTLLFVKHCWISIFPKLSNFGYNISNWKQNQLLVPMYTDFKYIGMDYKGID